MVGTSSETNMIRVGILEDTEWDKASFKGQLASETDLELALVTDNHSTMYELAVSGKIDILLLDLTIGGDGFSGLRLARKLKDAGCSVRILVVTNTHDEDKLRMAIDLDLDGYIEKLPTGTFDRKVARVVELKEYDLPQIIRHIMAGGKHYGSSLLVRMLADGAKRNSAVEPNLKLDLRDSDILSILLAYPRISNYQISLALNISEVTVKNRLTSLYNQLGLGGPGSRLQLIDSLKGTTYSQHSIPQQAQGRIEDMIRQNTLET